MPVTIYRSTDPGAPTLTNAPGNIITLLDAVLVNGYGSKPAAGWTKEFSGTNLAVYRNGASAKSRSYLRVDDTSASNYAQCAGYNTMSDINTGTGRFPTGTGFQYLRKSSFMSEEWTVIADARTVFVMVKSNSSPKLFGSLYFGDSISPLNDDINLCVLSGGYSTGYPDHASFFPQFNFDVNYVFWRKGPVSNVPGSPIQASGLGGYGLWNGSHPNYPTSASAGLLGPTQASGYLIANRIHYYLWDGSLERRSYGGRFRWIAVLGHHYADFTEYGIDLTGVGELTGKSLRTLGAVNGFVRQALVVDVDD